MITRYVLPLVALGLMVFAVMHVLGAAKPPAKTPTVSTEPPRNPFAKTVAGAGIVEPQTENISVGSPLPGIVVEVMAHVGQKVQPGDPLFRLDDREQQAELAARKAALVSAQAELTRLENQPRPEQLQMDAAAVAEAEANLANQRDLYRRTRELAARKVATAEDLVTRQEAYRVAQAQLARFKAAWEMQRAGAWIYDKEIASAAVLRAKAQVAQIETEIKRLVVRALVAGQVLQVNVRPGEFVGAAAGTALVVLGNVEQLHVRVDIDEYDIHRFHEGAAARAMLRGQPQQEFPLTFVRIEPYVVPKKSLTGDNTERVDTRVLQVIYAIDVGGRRLYVGQQLDVFIDASENVGHDTSHAAKT